MPLEGDAPNIVEYKMPIGGVNLSDGRLEISEIQAHQLKNLIVRGGIKKRAGYSKRQTKPVAFGSVIIDGIHRFHKQDGTRQLLIACAQDTYYESSDAQVELITLAVGTTLEDSTSNSEAAFDGVVAQAAASCMLKTSATSIYAGKTWGNGVARKLTGAIVTGSSDLGFTASASNITVVIEGSNDAFATAGVTLATIGPTANAAGLAMTDLSIAVDTAYTSHRAVVSHDIAAETMAIAEVQFFHTSPWVQIAGIGSDNRDTTFETWGAVDKVYICNGLSGGATWDGSTAVQTALNNESITPIQFLEYQDRLLMISDTEPGALRWSHSFDDTQWVSVAATGIRPDTKLFGMMIHSAADNQEQGQNAQVLLAGATGMYLFSGTNLSLTFSNYTMQQLAIKTGCNARKTMQWTPLGSIWLGTDGQVYLLPFNSLMPIPIGENIRSKINGYSGIESLTAANMASASAVYHDGFYKLSFESGASGYNDTQWWLDVFSAAKRTTAQTAANKTLSLGWFGPMSGMSFGHQAVLEGPEDLGELVTGEHDASVGAFVYDVSSSTQTDNGSSISYNWLSWYNPVSSKFLDTVAHRIEIELLNTDNDIFINYKDSAGGASNSSTVFNISGAGTFYGVPYYGESYYGGIDQSRVTAGIVPPVKQRFVSIDMNGDTSNKFELYAFRLEEAQQNAPLDIRR